MTPHFPPSGDAGSADKYVLDASMGVRNGLFCFCPVELDDGGNITAIVTGLTYLSPTPPGVLYAVVHEDGQEAVEDFCRTYDAELSAMRATATATEPQP